MSTIKLNHWYVEGNELCISLMNFFVRLSINDQSKKVVVAIFESNNNSLYFTFDTLEDAITFTENDIAKCFSIEEIRDVYMNSYLKLIK